MAILRPSHDPLSDPAPRHRSVTDRYLSIVAPTANLRGAGKPLIFEEIASAAIMHLPVADPT
jgi:hypothetical protein